jgi:hypothetical protein
MRIAVIIPTLDDDAALPRALARLARLDPAADEVLAVGGAASASCELTCRSAGARWIRTHPGRGGQLALGAARARADVFWFLYPDCEPPVGAIAAIRASVLQGAAGGHFRFQFGGPPSPFKHFLERCIAWRSRWGVVHGDQGIFVTRAAYGATAGFAVQPLFEEVALVRALRRAGRFVSLPLPLAVSPGRWEREGYLRRALVDRLLSLGFLCGVSAARLARWQVRHLRPASPRPRRNDRRSTSGGHEAHKG